MIMTLTADITTAFRFRETSFARETSPPDAAERLLADVRNFLDSPNPERGLKVPCTVAQFERLEAQLREQGCGGLEKTKIELVDDFLRIEFASAQHGFVAAYLSRLFVQMVMERHPHLRSTHRTDSEGISGSKMIPDYSISDRSPSILPDPLDPNATLILETACTQSLEDVRKKPARYLLRDAFGARLVIIVDFQTNDGGLPTSNNIKSIVWENWGIFEIEDAVNGLKDTGLVACEVSPIEGTLAYSSIVGTKSVKAGRIEDYTLKDGQLGIARGLHTSIWGQLGHFICGYLGR
ncbi:hypothetical protein C8J56DRAFT_897315 [Mycena floridula]|nr:hypothetical protein C8J56DRAFT_897315 [Mycena floridula]